MHNGVARQRQRASWRIDYAVAVIDSASKAAWQIIKSLARHISMKKMKISNINAAYGEDKGGISKRGGETRSWRYRHENAGSVRKRKHSAVAAASSIN